MKLIDLLAREMTTWPRQKSRFDYCVADKQGVVFFGADITLKLSQAPEDHETAYVTREAWEAEAKDLQSIPWTGEGLPPVGTVCELSESVLLADDEESAWFPPGAEVEVGGHALFKGAEGSVCTICITGDSSFTGTVSEECLRPIRGAEQITADEDLQKALAVMLKDSIGEDGSAIQDAVARRLYKAGYRKVQP